MKFTGGVWRSLELKGRVPRKSSSEYDEEIKVMNCSQLWNKRCGGKDLEVKIILQKMLHGNSLSRLCFHFNFFHGRKVT